MRTLWQTYGMGSVSIDFLRGVLGVLCVFFAYMTGRTAAAARLGRFSRTRLYSWVLRTVLCGVFLVFRHPVDTMVIACWALAAGAFAAGMWLVVHQKPPEDLTHEIFPE